MLTITSINMFKPLHKKHRTVKPARLIRLGDLLMFHSSGCVVLGLAHNYEAIKSTITFIFFFLTFYDVKG